MEEYREYTGRRKSKSPAQRPKTRYLTKLAVQSLVSILIFGAIMVPGSSENKTFSKLRETTKWALSYKIDVSKLTSFLSDLFDKKLPSINQGEFKNEKNESNRGNI